jgi:hypothetical protein
MRGGKKVFDYKYKNLSSVEYDLLRKNIDKLYQT